jgi:hypothetical protein
MKIELKVLSIQMVVKIREMKLTILNKLKLLLRLLHKEEVH